MSFPGPAGHGSSGVVLACAGAAAVDVLAPFESVLDGGVVCECDVSAAGDGACEDDAVCDVRTDAPISSIDPAKQIAVIFPKESVIAISPEKLCKISCLRQ